MGKRDDDAWYFRSRRIREREASDERSGALRVIFSRFWYVLVPLIGILFANLAQVRPALEGLSQAQALEHRDALRRREEVRTRVNAAKFELATVAVVIDTLYAPRIARYTVMRDSLAGLRQAYEQTLPATQARGDSLRAVGEELNAQLERDAARLRRRAISRDSLAARQGALEDSLVASDERIASRNDILYRLRHPKEARLEARAAAGVAPVPAPAPVPATGGEGE
jgi:hypothetical protein